MSFKKRVLVQFAIFACLMFVVTVTTFAQDGAIVPTSEQPSPLWAVVSMLVGVLVSLGVSKFKSIAIVAKYPKIVATILSAVIILAGNLTGYLPGDAVTIIITSLTAFMSAVSTYEVVVKPIAQIVNPPSTPDGPVPTT